MFIDLPVYLWMVQLAQLKPIEWQTDCIKYTIVSLIFTEYIYLYIYLLIKRATRPWPFGQFFTNMHNYLFDLEKNYNFPALYLLLSMCFLVCVFLFV